jgi:hypothetical protein
VVLNGILVKARSGTGEIIALQCCSVGVLQRVGRCAAMEGWAKSLDENLASSGTGVEATLVPQLLSLRGTWQEECRKTISTGEVPKSKTRERVGVVIFEEQYWTRYGQQRPKGLDPVGELRCRQGFGVKTGPTRTRSGWVVGEEERRSSTSRTRSQGE